MKAIILIHGFLTNTQDFKTIVPYLEEEYDKVALYEVPGHGIKPNYKLFKLQDTFNNLIKLYDELALNYDHIDCMGYSMGGALGTYLHQIREIKKLVLLAPANRYLNFNLINSRLKFIRKIKKEKNELEKKILNDNDKIALNMFFHNVFSRYTFRNIKVFMKIIRKCNKETIAITCPVLIMWGKLDQLVPYESAKYLYDLAIYEKKLVVLEDMSHLMLLSENNKEIIEEVISFLKEE